MTIDHKELGRLRSRTGEVENHIIDEFVAGHISRRDFLRRGTVIGMSLPLLGGILAACGSSTSGSTTSSTPAGSTGATIRAGIVVPTGDINPVTVADQGGLDMLGQTGEYLCLSQQDLTLKPVLATSWSPNSKSDVWTFKLRSGVKFHNGQAMTADDVVYTYKLQSEPTGKSNALSAFSGVLTPAGVKKIDDLTVQFSLEAPNGNFPYLCSSDNYNMIIIPNNYDPTKWQSSFIGTGPFVMKSYTASVSATFVRNEQYWGTKALPAETIFNFYSAQPALITNLQSGAIDVVGQFSVSGGEALIGGGYNVIKLRSSAHRELSMRCDMAPFTDPRVRQAVALSLNRPETVTSLFQGYSDIGNDSPFAPVFPSTNTLIAQRAQKLAQAKSLLAAAGHPSGFSTTLTTESLLEIPLFAQIVKQFAGDIGVDITLKIESSSAYYGDAVFGKSDWLDAVMSLVDFGHRSVPNVFLTAPLQSTGTWNAAHFKNTKYDQLTAQYVAASDLGTQRSLAGQIETLLLQETPIIYAYFYNYLTATAKNVSGVYPTAIGHLFLYNASKS
ncbi:MAG: ABC transporter substrate-binding protein [Acidimicrobiales bacterium]|jgi:peptide/nickel transport system substrate-binding protein